MIKHILPLIPDHTCYCEVFAGGASVFWNKRKSENETLNDINGNITNFYWQLKTNYRELRKLVDGTLHSEILFKEARNLLKDESESPLRKAWAWWTAANLSFSFTTTSFAFGTSGTWGQGTANKRDGFEKWMSDRLRDVEILNRDATKLILLKDRTNVFFYIDPPYLSSDCSLYSGYTLEQFTEMLDVLADIKGKFILSSYPEEVLLKYRHDNGWIGRDIRQTVTVDGTRDITNGKKMKTECLTMNYKPFGITLDMFADLESNA